MNNYEFERSTIDRLLSPGRYRPDPAMRATLLEKTDVLLLNPYVSASVRAELFPPERMAVDVASMVMRSEKLPSDASRGMLILAFLMMDMAALLRLEGVPLNKKSTISLSLRKKCEELPMKVKESAAILGIVLLQDAIGGHLLAKRLLS